MLQTIFPGAAAILPLQADLQSASRAAARPTLSAAKPRQPAHAATTTGRVPTAPCRHRTGCRPPARRVGHGFLYYDTVGWSREGSQTAPGGPPRGAGPAHRHRLGHGQAPGTRGRSSLREKRCAVRPARPARGSGSHVPNLNYCCHPRLAGNLQASFLCGAVGSRCRAEARRAQSMVREGLPDGPLRTEPGSRIRLLRPIVGNPPHRPRRPAGKESPRPIVRAASARAPGPRGASDEDPVPFPRRRTMLYALYMIRIMHTRPHARARTHTHTHTHARTHARARARTHTHTHTHTR
jgi:hypothetical protein